jgi:hypothetical protein
VTGVDIAPALWEPAKLRAAAEGLGVDLQYVSTDLKQTHRTGFVVHPKRAIGGDAVSAL